MHGEEKGVAPLKNAKKSSYPWAKIIPCVWQYIVVMKYRCDKALHYLECKIESLGPYPYLIFVRFLTFPPRRQAAGQGRRNVKKNGGAKLTYVVYLLNQLLNGSTQNWWCPIPHVHIRSGGPAVGHMKDIPIFHMTDNSCLDFLRQRLSVIIFLFERKFDLILFCFIFIFLYLKCVS